MYLKIHSAVDKHDIGKGEDLIALTCINRISRDPNTGACLIIRKGNLDTIEITESFADIERCLSEAGCVLYPKSQLAILDQKS